MPAAVPAPALFDLKSTAWTLATLRLQSADGAQWQTSTGSVAVLSDDELRGDEPRDEQLRRS